MLTFEKEIEKLMLAEGLDPVGKDRSDAVEMNDELVYVTYFCMENGIKMNRDQTEGVLLCLWSRYGDDNFTVRHAVNHLISAVLNAL